MSNALATFLFPIPPAHQGRVQETLHKLGWQPRRPAPAPPAASPPAPRIEDFVHFMSMVVLPKDAEGDDPRCWLLFEVCADDSEDELAKRLADALQPELTVIVDALGEGPLAPDKLASYLRRHAMRMGTSLLAQPGLRFVGTPGMTVQRIRDEARLAARVREILRDNANPPPTALGKLGHVRSEVFRDPALKWSLFSEPVPPEQEHAVGARIGPLILAAMRDYLWALLPLPLLVGLAVYFHDLWVAREAFMLAAQALAAELLLVVLLALSRNRTRRLWLLLPLPLLLAVIKGFQSWSQVGQALDWLALSLLAEIMLLGLAAAYGWRSLRAQEDADDPLDREPDADKMQALMGLENIRGVVQNHLSAQSRLKPGWVRRWALRLALWAVGEIARTHSRPGFLNKIGSIHFARWYLVPGSDRLVFLSNYDGSWQSYLEDFVARLREGLSSVWSNTRDFPKTNHLTSGGAADSARFRRWARRQQLPSPAWFTAYPELTASSIRTNAAIRLGLASASTEAQAAKWLSRLGYAGFDTLEAEQVPTLVFGGLARLRYAHAIVLRLGERAQARAWLRDSLPDISYGEHEGTGEATVIAFTATGLDKLGLPDAARHDFPTAFRQGMGHSDRARLLGDLEPESNCGQPKDRWGMDEPVDAVCLVYSQSQEGLQSHVQQLRHRLTRHGQHIAYERAMAALPEQNPATGEREVYEPFGFRDGVSQPIVLGTKGWTKPANAQHVVNPGEFVLGYEDNLGKRTPTPCADGRDYGRNGTFLVVRHFAQDREAFDTFLTEQAKRLTCHGPLAEMPIEQAQEWVAAKIIGRWRSGAPLVRSPETANAAADNDFMYGEEDPDGLRCPLGAHIRRANPRDTLEPKSTAQLAISNRHRILRVGRRVERDGDQPEGMFFMCLNADIERQFEFLQQSWVLGSNYHGLDNEVDPLLGPTTSEQAMTVPCPGGPSRLAPLKRFVRTLGGGYFFVPGKACMAMLAAAEAR